MTGSPPSLLPQALVFDFDGVIADTEPLHLRAFQGVLSALGLAVSHEEYLDRYLGYTDVEVFQIVAREQGFSLSAGKLDRLVATKTRLFQDLVSAAPVVFPGVVERVREWARQVPVAIASGALREEIDLVLAAAGLDSVFGVIVSANDPVPGKPSPEPYLLALRQLAVASSDRAPQGGFDPARCVAVEDSRWGAAAARAAGMRVVGVTSSYPADALADADHVVASVRELSADLVSRLLSARA